MKYFWRWVELSLSYGRRSVDEFILVLRSPLGPMTRCFPYPFFSDNCFAVLPVRRPLWWEDESVTYSTIADWSGHWGPITIHYCLIWDCIPSSSPLTTRRDYGGGILTRLHTGFYDDNFYYGPHRKRSLQRILPLHGIAFNLFLPSNGKGIYEQTHRTLLWKDTDCIENGTSKNYSFVVCSGWLGNVFVQLLAYTY
jgi:hypothetical protein